MSEEIKFDHFKDINELLEHIDLWYREDDIEYTRWFGLEELHILKIYITSLQQKVEQLEGQLEEKTYLYNKLQTESKSAILQLESIRKEAIEYIEKYLEREYFDANILETNTIYNRDLFKVKQILDKEK